MGRPDHGKKAQTPVGYSHGTRVSTGGPVTAIKGVIPWVTPRVVDVPFVNRPFESEIHGTVNFTQFCCVLLVTWCYRVLLPCYLRPK